MSQDQTFKRFSDEPLDAEGIRLAVRGEFDALDTAGDAARGFAAGWLTSRIPGLRGVPGGLIGAGSAVIGDMWDNFMYGRQSPEVKTYMQAEEVGRIGQYIAHLAHEADPALADQILKASQNFVQFIGDVVRDKGQAKADNIFNGSYEDMKKRYQGAGTRSAQTDPGQPRPELTPDGLGQAAVNTGAGALAGGPQGALVGLVSQPVKSLVDMGTDAAAKYLGMRPNLLNRALQKAQDAMAEVRLLAKEVDPALYQQVVGATNVLYSYLMRAKQSSDMKDQTNPNPNQPTYEQLGV